MKTLEPIINHVPLPQASDWSSPGPPMPRERSSGAGLRRQNTYMILLSYGLLLLTFVQSSPLHELAVLTWLVSFGLLALWNTGAAVGMYIAAVASYGTLYYSGVFSLFDRPDHPALLLLVGSLVFIQTKGLTRRPIDKLAWVMAAFLGYGIINGLLTGTFSVFSVSQFARSLGIPLVLFFLLMNSRPSRKDFWSFCFVMFLLAFHSTVVSVLWQLGDMRQFILPLWLTDPAVNPGIEHFRSGGILMHSAWNGLLLSLIFCMVYIVYHKRVFGFGRALLLMLGGAILVAIYFTYSRAVYLGTLTAITGLFWMRTGRDRSVMGKRIALVLVAGIALTLAFATRPAALEERVSNQNTVVWRLEIWSTGANMIAAKPVLGFGFRGYGQNAYKFLDDSDMLSRTEMQANQPAVHNTFLNIIVESGLVGFSLYALLHILMLLRAMRRTKEQWGTLGVVWLFVFMSVYFIQAQFALTQEPTTNALFYATLGFLVGLPPLRVSCPEIHLQSQHSFLLK